MIKKYKVIHYHDMPASDIWVDMRRVVIAEPYSYPGRDGEHTAVYFAGVEKVFFLDVPCADFAHDWWLVKEGFEK